METIVWTVHVIAAAAIIILVLMQQGKGADMGAAFGGGSSGSLFGASGSGNFLSRTTGVIATIFFITSLSLTYMARDRTEDAGLMSVMGDRIESSTNTNALMDGASSEEEQKQESKISDINESSKVRQIPD
ncbi:MAG: preprotein translocase subunit SecG [Nitrosomonas sp.]|nr:preprotein translocase subunit SecG [Nitrosomonas sp.]MDP1952068.1 preprotein translocase subunit SecG [Nitrosomonas sp.]